MNQQNVGDVMFVGFVCETRDREISIGIATRYWLDGPGIESRWERNFPHPSRPNLGPTQPPIEWVTSLSPGVKRSGRGVDHSPHLALSLRKSSTIPLLSIWAFVAGWTLPLPFEWSHPIVYWFYIFTLLIYILVWSDFLATDTEVPGSIPGATRFSE